MFNCKRCGTPTERRIVKQEYCLPCQYEHTRPRTYGVIHGGNVNTTNLNPFVQRAAQNRLSR